MTRLFVGSLGLSVLGTAVLFATLTSAQQKTQAAPQRIPVYDINREVSIQGTVVSFTENSGTAPSGPHVLLQTNSGSLDVHLGNARLLEANHFTLAAGDNVRVIGENVTSGTGSQFLARLIQKGNQALLLRSPQGLPLRPTGKPQGGVL
jgi:DNA/RNA endonuclease YhcR with UshA esterase domain